MIAIIKSGVANLASVIAALHRLGAEIDVTADAKKIATASHVIFPGVGAAGPAMAQLQEQNLVDTIRDLKQPILGICLGMQLLFDCSEESGGVDALGIIPGTVKKLSASGDTPIPHMGWNQLRLKDPHNPLLKDIADDSDVYFVHSYAAPIGEATLALTDYGSMFTAIVGYRNFYGCQFHPERSGAVGAQLLKNFLAL